MTAPGKKHLPRRWKRRLAIFLVVLLVGAVGAVELTSRASFCNSCHIMNSYYDSWNTGIHKDVQCVECHIAPGADNFISAKLNGLGQVVDDWLNRTSTKPSASVSDMSCSRPGCHNIEKLKKTETKTDTFLYQHGKHLGREYQGIVIHCTTCHSHVRGDKHFEVNRNVCITCHLMENGSSLIANPDESHALEALPAADKPAPKDCRKCHIPPQDLMAYQGLIIDHQEYLYFGASCDSCHHGVTAAPQKIDDARCLSCHIFGVERIESVATLHRVHSEGEHKVECFNCHGVTRHGLVAQSISLDPTICQRCHVGQHAMQKATYLHDEPSDPETSARSSAISPMYLVHVDCTGCHIDPTPLATNPDSGATVARAVPEACDNCHQEGFGGQMIPMWQRDTREMYDQAIALLPTEDDPWSEPFPGLQSSIEEAKRLLDLVRLDGSWGVHNPLYTERLIEQARKRLLEARQASREEREGEP